MKKYKIPPFSNFPLFPSSYKVIALKKNSIKKTNFWLFIAQNIVLLFFLLVEVQAVCANGPPIHGETAFTTGLNGSAVRSFLKIVRKSNSQGEVTVLMNPIILPYELLDNKLIIGAGIPLLNKKLEMANGAKRESGYGAGDLFLFGKYNLYQKDKHQGTFRMAGKFTLSLPTGETDASDQFGKLPPSLQRGAGSVNPSAMLIATKLWRRFGINGDLGYTFMTESDGLNRGDEFRYDISSSFRLLPSVFKKYPDHQVNLMFELNGTYTGKSEKKGITDQNSGGHILFLSPGLQYMYSNVILEGSAQIPGITSLNGAQMEPDWTLFFGFRWLLF